MTSKQNTDERIKLLSRYKNVIFILLFCIQLLAAEAGIASPIASGDGYMNNGGRKDIYSLPDKHSDIIGALPVGAPCDVLSVSGDWAEIKTYSEMEGFFTGWVIANKIEKAEAGDPVLPGNSPNLPLTPTPVPQIIIPPVDFTTPTLPTTIPQETAGWYSPQPEYTAYCSAIVNNPNGKRLHLRTAPSTQAESLGLYYTGVEVVCYSDPSQEWVYVSVGNRFGYMKTEFLYFGNEPESISPQTPIAYVTNNTQNAWLNLRSQPSTQAEVLGKYYNGERVTVIGKINEWYHVKADHVYGFMLSDYLSLTDASPSTQTGALRQYSTTQYILKGYTINASMAETMRNEFDIGVQIIIDPSIKLNSYPSSFNLYINGVMACSISTVQDSSIVAIPTQFFSHVIFEHDISLIQIVPVYGDGVEILDEAIYLK